jgi:integrase
MLREVLVQHLAKLDRVAAVAKLEPGFDRLRAEREDRRAAWAYRLLDAHGPNAHVSDADQAAMLADGLDQKDVEFISDHLARLQDGGSVPTKAHVLRPLLEKQGADATAMNFAQAQQVYFHGMMLALQQSDRRYRGVTAEGADLVDRLLKADVDGRVAAVSPGAASRTLESWAAPQAAVNREPPTIMAAVTPEPAAAAEDDRVSKVGEKLKLKRTREKSWHGKTATQALQLFALFEKYLSEQCGIDGMRQLRQTHLARFINFLQFEIYKHYGKSSADHRRSIAELLKIAQTKPAELRGVEAPTLNRHVTFLHQLIDFAEGQGVPLAADLNTTRLRARQSKEERDRNARPILKTNGAAQVFLAAPFTGCRSWEDPLVPGDTLFHRALYYVPLMLYYQGGRREEFCGLAVEDVILDNGPLPYIHIAPNKFRRIKNAQSVRNSPLHPETLRLGFLDYVAAVRALGYERLFPDLYSPSTKSPLGDRFYDEFRPVLTDADTDETGFVIHSIRGGFGDALKQRRVSEEERGDLLGHVGKSETSERYCAAYDIQILYELICKVPVVTAHMEPQPLRLLPWVQDKQIAPFSRQVRKQSDRRAKATKAG